MKTLAFSLIELLVVMAIIGVLAAIAVPVYRQYQVKARVGAAIGILRYFNDGMTNLYNRGISLGTSANVNGVVIPNFNGAFQHVVVNAPPVYSVWYINNSLANGIASNQLLFCVEVSGLSGMVITDGFGAYVDPNPTPSAAQRSAVCMYTTFGTTGVDTQKCGIWAVGAPWYIPFNYLPVGCSCQSIANGNTGCT